MPHAAQQPRRLELQISALVEAFPELGVSAAAAHDYIRTRISTSNIMHFGACGWYVVPRRSALAADYLSGVMRVNSALDRIRGCRTWEKTRCRYIESEYKTSAALENIGKHHEGDFLFIQAQPGFKHVGRSVSTVRNEFYPQEFGLGAVEVGCMLIANPGLLVMEDDHIIACPGDTCNIGMGPDSVSSPCYLAGIENSLEFGCRIIDQAKPTMGAATGFDV
ncbi:MAG TPA: hypothetical protein VN701_02235 [Candidatus Paceibacterota bacterium]|nr:hypothetical protein [Candidatus Paceibacterota bacterium]